jgi:uncharacterized membrane protein YjjB (DUF3815 family)
MTDWTDILLKAFWCGWAAVGFGVLFNVLPRSLFAIWIGGAIAGLVKFAILFLSMRSPVVQGSFFAALAVSFFCIPIAHWRREPVITFVIPAVIPLVPGVFAYRSMLGFIKLAGNIGSDYSGILSETVHSGVITLFIIMAIAIGVAIPISVMRKDLMVKLKLRNKH